MSLLIFLCTAPGSLGLLHSWLDRIFREPLKRGKQRNLALGAVVGRFGNTDDTTVTSPTTIHVLEVVTLHNGDHYC